ncbi:MAG: HEAT repeat domain-containing protein [Candidatus Lokiarchaeia archaeon]
MSRNYLYSRWDLGRIKNAKNIEELIKVLNHEKNPKIRRTAAEYLGDLKDKRAVEPLIQTLKNDEEDIRAEAAKALGSIKDLRAVPPLIQALKDENWEVREDVAWALGKIGDTRAVEPLLQALKDESNEVRTVAAEALGGMGDSRVVPDLIQALKDEEAWVRMSAASQLGRLGDKRALQPLLGALIDKDRRVRSLAASALGKIADESVVNPLIQMLEEDVNQAGAAYVLGEIGDSRAVYPLINTISTLTDEKWGVRATIAKALGKIGNKKAVEPLIPLLTNEESHFIEKERTAWALDELGWKPKNDAEKLHYFVAKEKWEEVVKIGAAAVKPLIKILKMWGSGTPNYVREEAAWTLGEIGETRAVEPLTRLMEDEENFSVQQSMKEALEKIQKKSKLNKRNNR